MDNIGFKRDPEKGTEMHEVHNALAHNALTHNGGPQPGPSVCRPEVCRRARESYKLPELTGNPWHRKKTIALSVLLALFIVWIIVYTTLSQLKML